MLVTELNSPAALRLHAAALRRLLRIHHGGHASALESNSIVKETPMVKAFLDLRPWASMSRSRGVLLSTSTERTLNGLHARAYNSP